MSAEDYYCPLCGNKPYKSFVPCRLLSNLICIDCDDAIREYFMHGNDSSELPGIMQNIVDYSGLSLKEAKEIWLKEQIITSLLELRDFINYCDESGDIWEDCVLDELLRQAALVGDFNGYSGLCKQ